MQIDPIKQRDILDQDYVSRKNLQDLYGWSRRQADMEFRYILEDIRSDYQPIMYRGKTCLIPLDRILNKYPLNYARISRSANRKIQEETIE